MGETLFSTRSNIINHAFPIPHTHSLTNVTLAMSSRYQDLQHPTPM